MTKERKHASVLRSSHASCARCFDDEVAREGGGGLFDRGGIVLAFDAGACVWSLVRPHAHARFPYGVAAARSSASVACFAGCCGGRRARARARRRELRQDEISGPGGKSGKDFGGFCRFFLCFDVVLKKKMPLPHGKTQCAQLGISS